MLLGFVSLLTNLTNQHAFDNFLMAAAIPDYEDVALVKGADFNLTNNWTPHAYDIIIDGNEPGIIINDNYVFQCQTLFSIASFRVVYIIITVSFCAVILIGNMTVIILPLLNRSFRVPIILTIQSFAFVSLINGLVALFQSLTVWSDIIYIHAIMKDKYFHCYWGKCTAYIRNVMSLHLCLLASQRVFLTVFPLKSLVYHRNKNIRIGLISIYSGCVIFELLSGFFGIRACGYIEQQATFDFGKVASLYVDIITLNILVCILLVAAMIISVIQLVRSKNIQQTSRQKSQSRMASVTIVTYITLYCPLQIALITVDVSCTGGNYVCFLTAARAILEVIVHSFAPFLFCLRLKNARRTLWETMCKC